MLEKASQYRIPVLVHTGSMMMPLRSKYCQVVHIDDLCVDFPDLTIIAAHAGGVFNYPQMISFMIIKLNIMVDISAWQLTASKDFPGFCKALRKIMDFTEPDRILFASDSPSFRSVMSNADWVQLIKDLPQKAPEGITFTEEEIQKVMGGNARKLLNL